MDNIEENQGELELFGYAVRLRNDLPQKTMEFGTLGSRVARVVLHREEDGSYSWKLVRCSDQIKLFEEVDE